MPELPEVETIRTYLEPRLKNKRIANVAVLWEPLIKNISTLNFKQQLKGQVLLRVGRYGKFLIFYFSDIVLVSHLRMEGKYAITTPDTEYDKHDHVFFTFTDNTQLRYRDVRKFGTFHLFVPGEEFNHKPLVTLGPQPFDESFSAAYLLHTCKKVNRNVKAVLLDQTIVAGFGNIYVDETLFCAKIHPERKANTLKESEWQAIITCGQQILTSALESGGSTIRSYVNAEGKSGSFQDYLNVYGRKGLECKNCQQLLIKIKVSGRGTVFCVNCQK